MYPSQSWQSKVSPDITKCPLEYKSPVWDSQVYWNEQIKVNQHLPRDSNTAMIEVGQLAMPPWCKSSGKFVMLLTQMITLWSLKHCLSLSFYSTLCCFSFILLTTLSGEILFLLSRWRSGPECRPHFFLVYLHSQPCQWTDPVLSL